jgi:putative methionine-R-sulfoxide reductase with GAF domain
VVEPAKPNPDSQPSADPQGEGKPTHAGGAFREGDRRARAGVENFPGKILPWREEMEKALEASEERLRSQSRELTLLHRICSAVSHEQELPDVLSTAVEALAEAYGHARLRAYLLEDEELVLQNQVGCQDVKDRIPLTEGVPGRVVGTGRPALVEDVGAASDSSGAAKGVTQRSASPFSMGARSWGCSTWRAWVG